MKKLKGLLGFGAAFCQNRKNRAFGAEGSSMRTLRFSRWIQTTLLAIILSGCAGLGGKDDAQPISAPAVLLSGPARYFEKAQNKEIRFDIEILSFENFAKMEVTGLLGLKFATFSEGDKLSTAVLHTEKKYFFATNPGLVLRFFVGENIDMRNLVKQLKTGIGNARLQVTQLDSGKKKLELNNSKYELVWVYETSPTQVQDKFKAQKMDVPFGYRTYRLSAP